MSEKVFYFDYNATHPPFIEILEKNSKDYYQNYFNPSGASRFSLLRQSRIEEVRAYLSELTGKKKEGFVFSSTGTEANHILIGSLFHSKYKPGKVYISPFEHSSVYGALEVNGIEPILLPTDKNGIVDLNYLEKQLSFDPQPVILLVAGNETGIIQPYEDIYSLTQKAGIPFLSDLMQAFGKISLEYSCIDGFTFSGHKIGAGMGVAVSYIPPEWLSRFHLYIGGNQENGLRAGTENSAAIASLKDVSILQENHLKQKNIRLLEFQSKIETCLKDMGAEVVGLHSPRLPSTTFALLPLEELDFFIMGMEEKRIVISTGSSCKSRVQEPSFSLLRMGYTEEEALKAIRISTGYFTSEEEVAVLLEEMPRVLRLLG